MMSKRKMLQLKSISYDNRQLLHERIVARNTRLADTRYIFEIEWANLELCSKSPYNTGGKLWNELPRHTQDLNTK